MTGSSPFRAAAQYAPQPGGTASASGSQIGAGRAQPNLSIHLLKRQLQMMGRRPHQSAFGSGVSRHIVQAPARNQEMLGPSNCVVIARACEARSGRLFVSQPPHVFAPSLAEFVVQP